MKKLFICSIFSFLVLQGWSQEVPDIDSVLNKLDETTVRMSSVLSGYLPAYQELIEFDTNITVEIDDNELLEKRIVNDFQSVEYFYTIIDFNRSVKFMYSSLNPDYNINSILVRLESFLQTTYKKDSNASKVQRYCYSYFENLHLLSEVINNYENVPYFCFQAYPKFSNEDIDENLHIINSRLESEKNSMGYRTKKFLSLEEVDLSNSNFSMDLLFKDHQNIRKLDLSNTKISSIEYLADLDIEWLNLSNTNIDQRDLIYLRYMPSIYYLDLSNTNLSRMAITELRNHLMLSKKNCIFSKREEEKEKSSLVTETSDISY